MARCPAPPRRLPRAAAAAAVGAVLGACAATRAGEPTGTHVTTLPLDAEVDVGTAPGYRAVRVVEGLTNPAGLAFREDGALTICDGGNARVCVVEDGELRPWCTEFRRGWWQSDPDTGATSYGLGPLSAVWLPGGTLAVTDAGRRDGDERVRFYDGPGPARSGGLTNPVGPTTAAGDDRGEGSFTGLCATEDGRTLFLAANGNDARSWVLACDVATRTLRPFASIDLAGVDQDTPLQCRTSPHGTLLVVYAGAFGKPDGLIAEWDPQSGDLLRTWTLPGLVDPSGMDVVPGSPADPVELAVTDLDFRGDRPRGRVARVRLPGAGGAAEVVVVADRLLSPVSCAFGPDGRLYVSEVGARPDAGLGRVIAIDGF